MPDATDRYSDATDRYSDATPDQARPFVCGEPCPWCDVKSRAPEDFGTRRCDKCGGPVTINGKPDWRSSLWAQSSIGAQNAMIDHLDALIRQPGNEHMQPARDRPIPHYVLDRSTEESAEAFGNQLDRERHERSGMTYLSRTFRGY